MAVDQFAKMTICQENVIQKDDLQVWSGQKLWKDAAHTANILLYNVF